MQLHPRSVYCYDDREYSDEYGQCICSENDRGQDFCDYFEYCEDSSDPTCYRRKLAAAKPEITVPSIICKINTLKGIEHVDAEGYCACSDYEEHLGCKYFKYSDLDKACQNNPDYSLDHGLCLPDENGRPTWYTTETDAEIAGTAPKTVDVDVGITYISGKL